MNKWYEVWKRREVNKEVLYSNNSKEVFLELKRIAGYDIGGDMLAYEEFYRQYVCISNELSFCASLQVYPIKSVYEVGCGAGANLYLYENDKIRVGGIDYSEIEIKVADTVLRNPVELVCDEATKMSVEIKYDALLSNGCFSYFENYDYAAKVLELMYQKTNYSIGIIDIHAANKKDAFIEFRKQLSDDYEERYRDLPKLFYDKTFFLDFAEKHNMGIRFSQINMEGYWNNDFTFSCFMTKNEF